MMRNLNLQSALAAILLVYWPAMIFCSSFASAQSSQLSAFPPANMAQRQLDKYLAVKTGGRHALTAMPWGMDAQRWRVAEKYRAAGLPKQQIYLMIAADLKNARSLLARQDAVSRLNGLGMVLETARVSSRNINDHRLAARICDAYAIPFLDYAHPDPDKGTSKQDTLQEIAIRYFKANEIAKFTECYRLLLECAPNRNTADAARMRIAQGLELQGKFGEAITYLDQIDPYDSMRGGRERIPLLKRKLENDASTKNH